MTVDAFIQRMLAMFGPPNTADPETYIAETRKALANWRADILAEAADRIVKTSKWFPKPAEVIEVCEAIAAGKTKTFDNGPKNTDWTTEAIKAADHLIQCDMGRAAADEGWITQLHDYCRKHRALPMPGTIFQLKKEARLFEKAYSDVCSGKGGALEASLKRLGETMMAKRNELAAVAHGEDVTRGNLSDLSRRMSGDTQ